MSADTIDETAEESVVDESTVEATETEAETTEADLEATDKVEVTDKVEATEEVEATDVAEDESDESDESDETDETDEKDEKDVAEDAHAEDESRPSRLRKLRVRPSVARRTIAALLGGVSVFAFLVVAIGGGVYVYLQYSHMKSEVTALQQSESDRAAVAKLAKDYALKSLTYTFEDPEAFFRSVEDGVSQTLKDKYVNAASILKSVMVQAQVTSSGEVLATDPVAQPGDAYQVVVSAAQTTRNMQNPKPRISLILLQVTVNKVAGGWQVSDIGPKTGAHVGNAEAIAPPVPSPAPAPAPRR